jgi:SulP family sulfate permease
VRSVTDRLSDEERVGFEAENPDVALPEGTEVFEIAGSFFFGAAHRFTEALSELSRHPHVVILRMRDVYAIDATGLHALEEVHTRLAKAGTAMILSGVRAQPLEAMVKSGTLEKLEEQNVLGTFREAAIRAWALASPTDVRVPATPPTP